MYYMKTQKYKHGHYYCPNGTNYLASEVKIIVFLPSFSNTFHCFSSIMLGYFNLFLTVVPNLNSPTRIWSSRDISSWYQKYLWLFCRRLCTLLGLTGNIFPSVPSWFFVLISVQKMDLHGRSFGAVLIFYDITPETVHLVVPNGDWIWLVHIHLYQIQIGLCRTCICVLDKRAYTLNFQYTF